MPSSPTNPPPHTIAELWCYPVKGLAGHRQEQIAVTPDSLFAGDRAFAVTKGHPASHDRLAEGWLPKRHFIQLLSEARLAGLSVDYDGADAALCLFHRGQPLARSNGDDYSSLSNALYQLMPEAFAGPPVFCRLEKGGYTDTPAPWITIGGTASIGEFARLTGCSADSRRFRLNIIIHTTTPFEERSWAGRHITLGGTEIEVIEPVGRCGAISVHPDTQNRERDYLPEMEQAWGHTDLGMFARICRAGHIAIGDSLKLI